MSLGLELLQTYVDVFYTVLDIENEVTSIIDDKNISLTDIRIIRSIQKLKESQQNTGKTIASLLSLTPSAISIATKKLTNSGYLVREYSKHDRRILYLNLTDKGKQIFYEFNDLHYKILSDLFTVLSDTEKHVLQLAIQKLMIHFAAESDFDIVHSIDNVQNMLNIIDLFFHSLSKEEEKLRHIGPKSISIKDARIIETVFKLKAKEENTISNLAISLNLTTSTISIQLSKLEKKGFIKRVRSNTDFRNVFVEPTELASFVFNQTAAYFQTLADMFEADIEEDQFEIAIHTANKVLQYFQSVQQELKKDS